MKFGNFLQFAFIVGWIVFPGTLRAQSKAATPPGQRSTLNEQQKRGEGLFLQRCSVCHVAKVLKKTHPSFGPSLSGLLKNDTSKETAVRQIILNGGLNMPGFQYGLEPKEIDDVIAYLKTL